MSYSLLLVASLPPPIAGQSVATVILRRYLRATGVEHRIVDLSREFYTRNPWLGRARRAAEVVGLAPRVLAAARELEATPAIFYLQLGQSTAAMVRDLPLLALARVRGWPIVLHVHGGGFRDAFDRAPRSVQAAVRRCLRFAARVIVLSPSLAGMFDGLVAPDKIVSVANGTPIEVEDRARELPVTRSDSTQLTVLFLSNMIDTKGYTVVLEAAALARDHGLGHRFVLAGSATEWSSVDPAAFIRDRGLDNTEFVGPVAGENKLALLEAADVFVLPTCYPTEGQPIAVLEAMQFGLPIVTTRAGGIADVVREPDNGIVIPPRSPEAVLDAIERLAADPKLRNAIAIRNRDHALANYSSEAHGRAMADVFAKVAAEH